MRDFLILECSPLTLRYGFHDVQKAHEEAAGLSLVQLVTPGAVAYEGLRTCKLGRDIRTDTVNGELCLNVRF